jgi:hypothetical protein
VWAADHRTLLSRVGGAVALLASAAAAVVALQPPSGSTGPPATVVGLSIHIGAPTASRAGSIIAAYRVVDRMQGGQVRVTRVTGPFLSTTHSVSEVVGAGPSAVDRVAGTPNCARDASLQAGSGRYPLALTVTGSDGRVTHIRRGAPTSTVDWGSAVREDCWARRARQSVEVTGVTAHAQPAHQLVVLDVRLTSAMPSPVLVRAVDIADVSTVDPADSGVLSPGASRLMRVRVPVPDCSIPPAPQKLTWVVGPAGDDPAASFVTVLRTADQRAVTTAVAAMCEPPSTTVRVLTARVLPLDPILADPSGIAFAIRVRVTAPATRAELGPSTRSLTSDARTVLSHADIHIVHGSGATTIVWQTSCARGAALPPRLPVGLGRESAKYAVTLDDPLLARTYAGACGMPYPADAMTSNGWTLD